MGNSGLPHVTKVQQRGDDTIVVYIQTDGFTPGQEVEVSAYLVQDSAYAFYNDKKRLSFPDHPDQGQPAEFHVELPSTELNADQPVTVITRVTEVWSTVLPKDTKLLEAYGVQQGEQGGQGEYADHDLKAAWKYPEPVQDGAQNPVQSLVQNPVQDSEGKAQGDPAPPPPSNADGAKAAQP